MENKYPQFPQRLRSLRDERNMTIDDLSEVSGILPSVLVSFENNSHIPTHISLRLLSMTFDVGIKELTGENEAQK